MEAHQQRGISLERSKNICIHQHITELTLLYIIGWLECSETSFFAWP
jgi:hypothetical protein